MSHLKLMKLLYLSDREALKTYGLPLSGDRIVSMPHGPVLSNTLTLMDGDVESAPGGWEEWISDKANHEVSLRTTAVTLDDLDELSEADIEVLQKVWDEFGHMSKWEIRDYTHDHCPEWEDPHGSSSPIPFRRVLTMVGYTPAQASTLTNAIEDQDRIDSIFASL